MRPGARLAAAIEILDDILARHRPASLALSDWGRAHRFAGSGDRAAIGNLVFDALRRKASLAARMGSDAPRALALALAAERFAWVMQPEAVAALCDDGPYAPEPLSQAECEGLAGSFPQNEWPDWVRGDYPEWLQPSLARAFGDRAGEEGAALAQRAPIDLRVNTLKASRERVAKALKRFAPEPTPFSPVGLRIAPPEGAGRSANVEADAAHGRGWFEVQDEGSQLAALLTGVGPGMQVADVCAGSGGKTLGLAGAMENKGQIYAFDRDRLRLRPIFDRLRRAGARNVQVLPAGEEERLGALAGRMDVVLVDAPCTGSGVWRRRPDAKWRLKPRNVTERVADQRAVLALAVPLLRPGGRLVYVTCSILPEENGDQVAWFLKEHPDFAMVPYLQVWAAALPEFPPLASADAGGDGLLLTPARHGTDGFYVAVLEKEEIRR